MKNDEGDIPGFVTYVEAATDLLLNKLNNCTYATYYTVIYELFKMVWEMKKSYFLVALYIQKK